MRTTRPRVLRYLHSTSSRFVVEGLRVHGKRVRKFFASQREAKAWLRAFEARAAKEGKEAPLLISDALRIEAVTQAERLRAVGSTLTQAVDHYLAHLAAVERSCTVNELIAKLRRANEEDGLSIITLRDRKSRLSHFAADFGERMVASVAGHEISDWLRDRGRSLRDRENHRAALNALFNFGVLHRFTPKNPVAEVPKKRRIPAPEVLVLTAAQMRAMLAAAEPAHLPFYLFGGFAGLRSSEIERLDWGEVDLVKRTVFVNRAGKTGKRYVSIPDNLAAWLAPLARQSGRVMTGMETKAARAAGRAAAGLAAWPDNALRHSYGTFHLAHHRNGALTAHEMGNSIKVVRTHYDSVARPAEGAEWWAITPPAEYGNVVAFGAEVACG